MCEAGPCPDDLPRIPCAGLNGAALCQADQSRPDIAQVEPAPAQPVNQSQIIVVFALIVATSGFTAGVALATIFLLW
jgi:hypothetical protein